MKKRLLNYLLGLLALCSLPLFPSQIWADLRNSPSWFDTNSPGQAPDWHYRIPVIIPFNAQPNNTVKLNIDFNNLLSQLNISGSFDPDSVRVVRENGLLCETQEFCDSVFNDATDSLNNARGQVRFILQDPGPGTCQIYFDITENGLKTAWPAASTLDGNFEFSTTGTQDPPGWSATKTNAGFDAQIRPLESPNVNTNGAATGNGAPPIITDGTPHSGRFSYLLGCRTNNEPGDGNPAITLSRIIAVPASNAGNITIHYRVEGWDSATNNSTRWDYLSIRLRGATTTELVGPAAGNYTSLPFSPNLGDNLAGNNRSGYGQYNGWDTDTRGRHRSGMTLARGSEPWFSVTADLTPFAGQTISLEITTRHITLYRSWYHIDDVEWSLVNGTLGIPQAFGLNLITPNDTSSGLPTVYNVGSTLNITACIDARPAAAILPVTANLYDPANTLIAGNIELFNDGTHGDLIANDATWTNNGTIPADPTYTFLLSSIPGNNWQVQIYAKDASQSLGAGDDGLIKIPGQPDMPVNQANYYNVDRQIFTLQNSPDILLVKSVSTYSDPVNNTNNPKAIPGAMMLYNITASNQGYGATDNDSLAITDQVPAGTALYVQDLTGFGSGPVLFTDNSPASGLTCQFISLGNSFDDLAFSEDNGLTYNYTPIPDANGCDANITHLRIIPKGAFLGTSGGAPPGFSLRFQVRVQ